jgi:hypothetical protein
LDRRLRRAFMRRKSPLFVLPIVVVIVAAVVVWAAWLPSDPELAAAESAFAGMVATGVALATGRMPT